MRWTLWKKRPNVSCSQSGTSVHSYWFRNYSAHCNIFRSTSAYENAASMCNLIGRNCHSRRSKQSQKVPGNFWPLRDVFITQLDDMAHRATLAPRYSAIININAEKPRSARMIGPRTPTGCPCAAATRTRPSPMRSLTWWMWIGESLDCFYQTGGCERVNTVFAEGSQIVMYLTFCFKLILGEPDKSFNITQNLENDQCSGEPKIVGSWHGDLLNITDSPLLAYLRGATVRIENKGCAALDNKPLFIDASNSIGRAKICRKSAFIDKRIFKSKLL